MRWLLVLAALAGIAQMASAAEQVPAVRITGPTALDEIGIYRVGYQYRDGHAGVLPLGWTGHFEANTGVSCSPFGTQKGKRAFLLHCPWRGGVGFTYQEFRLTLPQARTLAFACDTAMRSDVIEKSDGVTFRVFVDGQKVYDEHRTDDTWKPFRYDLSAFAGKTLTLRLETDAGSKDDSNWDYALWGEPRIEAPGKASAAYPTSLAPLPLARVLNQGKGVLPSTAQAKTLPPKRQGNSFVLQSTAPDADLSVSYTPGAAFLGGLRCRARVGKHSVTFFPTAGAEILLAAGKEKTVSSLSPDVHAKLLEAKCEGNAVVTVQRYTYGESAVTVRTRLQLHGRSLQVDAEADCPGIAAISYGNPNALPIRRAIQVPYFGSVTYLPDPGLYLHSILDWSVSGASNLGDTRALYNALTDGSRRAMRERCFISASPYLAEVLPNNPAAQPSPYRATLGKRVMLDIWGGSFTGDAAWLDELASYGIRNISIIKHDWQRSGYDNAYPNFVPANASLGGDPGMKQFVQTATRLGHLVSLHENYVDFYPNSELWQENDIAHDQAGEMIKAWYNGGVKMQSYATAPTAMVKYARLMAPEIHRRYGTNASYLDVHTCVPPWWRVDYRAGVPGAGTMHSMWRENRALFSLMRKAHGGPLFGEGAYHWYWSGSFDGAEAQVAGGMNTPLLVDFDLLKIKPLQLNHGMGYLERWLESGYGPGWGSRLPTTAEMDRYRAQEVAFGHQPFVAQQEWKVLPYVWREHHLLTPVSARYATAAPRSILYQVNGQMLPVSAAAAAGQLDRVAVTYDNGLRIWANTRKENWRVGEGKDAVVLPPDGWLARGAGVTAWTALMNGVIADYAETAESVFADARTEIVRPKDNRKEIRVAVQELKNLGNRRFSLSLRWDAGQSLDKDYTCFLHFCGRGHDEDIRFQLDHQTPKPTSAWKAGDVILDGPYTIALPKDLKDGDYGIRTGLYHGERLQLKGPADAAGRADLGTLLVRNNGAEISFTPSVAAEEAQAEDSYLARLNTGKKKLDFGPVITDGSALVQRQSEGGWLVTVQPRNKAFSLALRPARLPGGKAGAHYTVEALDASHQSLGKIAAQENNGVLTWQTGMPGACAYRVR